MGPIDILKAPMGLLVKQAAFLVREAYGKPERPFQNRFMRIGENCTQRLTQIDIDEGSMGASVDQITERFLKPMAHGLAHSLPRDVAFGALELPSGCQAARQMWDDVSVRVVTGWWERPIVDETGEVTGYEPPCPMLRMDVIVTTEAAA